MEERFQQPPDWQWGEMTERGGMKLRTGSLVRHEKPVANLVIGPGMREFTQSYFETISDFSNRGYNVYFINWMGQGGSESILPGRFHRIAKIFGFDRDAKNLLEFAETKVPDNAPKVYLGHSTGGLIGLLAIVRSPKTFAATVLLAPFLGYFNKNARFLEATLKYLPFTRHALEHYIPGGQNWMKRGAPSSTMQPGDYSADRVRMLLRDEWAEANPDLQVGDLTLGGFHEACRAIASLHKKGVPEKITTPLMMVSAGKELIVSTAAIFNMASRIPDAIHTHIPEARHETCMETDQIRNTVINNADGFFRSRLG
ncbi:MAG: alpha/beta hydrolase fold protein [Micavibrio sp.]|nr:alpha/beta hydrolase fold protein [Micavibrio sp.]